MVAFISVLTTDYFVFLLVENRHSTILFSLLIVFIGFF